MHRCRMIIDSDLAALIHTTYMSHLRIKSQVEINTISEISLSRTSFYFPLTISYIIVDRHTNFNAFFPLVCENNYFWTNRSSSNCWLKWSLRLPLILLYTALINILCNALEIARILNMPTTKIPMPTGALIKAVTAIPTTATISMPRKDTMPMLKLAPMLSPHFSFII